MEIPVPYPLATDTALLIHKSKLTALVTGSPETVRFELGKKKATFAKTRTSLIQAVTLLIGAGSRKKKGQRIRY